MIDSSSLSLFNLLLKYSHFSRDDFIIFVLILKIIQYISDLLNEFFNFFSCNTKGNVSS